MLDRLFLGVVPIEDAGCAAQRGLSGSAFLFLATLCENPAMPANPRRAKLFFIALLLIAGAAIIYTLYANRPWNVPEEAKREINPVAPSPAALAAAKPIYSDKCANCHGDTGKGDGPDAKSYYPAPTDLTDSSRMENITDGELFYKISEGHKPMPAFKRKLTAEQRWQLVLLVRSFAAAKSSSPAAQNQP